MAAAVPYLVVGAIGLIGEWLLGPKSGAQNSTQPSEMPSVTQALRGTPLFINFGQVRVSSQIIWTKNWKAVRQKGGGKGAAKGGGSGGGGSAKGASSGAYGYEYSWDLIFHFGMVDVPCAITKAWIGSDRVVGATVAQWNGSVGTSGQPVNPFQDNFFRTIFDGVEGTSPFANGQADMHATEAFYSPGFPTGDANLTAWPYFTTQEGVSPAWPSTCWLGFNQLALGSTPAVPQLSVELTPSVADFTVDHHVYPQSENPAASMNTSARFMKADGIIYALQELSGTSSHGASIVDIVSGTVITLSDATGLADVHAIKGSDPTNRMDVFPVPYSPYFYNAFLYDDLFNPTMVFVLYKIASGAVSKVGSISYVYTGGSNKNLTKAIGVGRIPSGDVALAYFGRSTDHGSYFTTILAPETVDGGGDGSLTVAYDRAIYTLPFGNNFFGNVTSPTSRPVVQVAFVPDTSATATTVKAVIYIDRARVQHELSSGDNTYIQGQGATYPNGFMLTWDYPGGGAFGITDDWRINTFLVDSAGDPIMPFSDIGLDSTGAAGSDYDDYFIAHSDSGYFMVGRSYSDIPYKAHLMVFTSGGLFSGNIIADYSDATEWGGVGSPGPTSNQTLLQNWWIDPDNFIIWFAATRQQTATGKEVKYVKFGNLNFHADLTPPEIIKKILTSAVYGFDTASLFGFTITADSIDDTSYLDAVSKCNDEGIKVSVSYTNQDSLLTILNDLLALYGGTLAEQNGMIFFDVFRATDTPIRTIDNDHLISTDTGVPPVNVTKGAIQDGYNSVQYQYLDRLIDYKRNQVTVADEVDIDLNGYRNKVYPSQFVMTGSLAQLVAERALWSNMYGRDNYEFKLGWKDADLRPGNQITLVDSFHPALQSGVKVVINKKQEQERGVFTVNATRVFNNHLTAQHGYTNIASIDPGIDSILDTPGPMDFRAYELPQEFQGANGFVYFGYNQSSYVMGAQLYISRDLGANYVLTQDVQPFIISGRMAQPLPLRDPGFVETDVEFYVLPRSGFVVSSPDFITNYTLDDATAVNRQVGLATLIVGSEAIAMQNLTLLSENHYRASKMYRGWGGTPIAAVSSGAFWHQHGTGMFAFPISEDDIGNKLFYKIIGYNFAGHVYDISSVVAKEYDVKGLRWLPRCATPIRTFVTSPQAWDPSSEFRGDKLAVVSGGCAVVLSWPDAANNEGFGSGGAGAGGFGHFSNDGTIDAWRIDVSSVNGTKVSSFVASTRSFNYSVAQNSADFGGFAHTVVYQVTPYNVKGDGPTTSTRTLSLIW
jgi:hypothetical protein